MRHVLHLGHPSPPCRRQLGRRDDVSFPGLGTLGERAKGGAGIHGPVSIGGAAISSYRVGRHGDPVEHRSDVVVTARHPRDGTGLMAGDRDGEAHVGEPLAVSDSAARPHTWPESQSGKRRPGISANDRTARYLQDRALVAASFAVHRIGRRDRGGGTGPVVKGPGLRGPRAIR